MTIVGDNDNEPFNVNLSGASGANIGDGTGTGTIVNDDDGGGGGGGKGGGEGGKGKNKAAVVNDGPTVAFPAKNDPADSSGRDDVEFQSVPVQAVAQTIVSTDEGDHSTETATTTGTKLAGNGRTTRPYTRSSVNRSCFSTRSRLCNRLDAEQITARLRVRFCSSRMLSIVRQLAWKVVVENCLNHPLNLTVAKFATVGFIFCAEREPHALVRTYYQFR